MLNIKWLNLQLFAGEGGGEGAAASGEGTDGATVDAGQKRLLELGVPADKIRRRANKSATVLPEGAVKAQEKTEAETEQQVAAAKPTEETKPETPARMSWDEIMADPEYNKQMQAVVQSRLKSAKSAEETLSKLTPALEVLARKHNLDMENMDYDALTKAINEDNSFYEEKALEMGVSVETAKKIDQEERQTARTQREEARNLEQQKIQQHIMKLQQEGEAMKAVFPNFDLRTELQNPAFARMTSPNVGISVEDAYYAVHRNEIQAASMQVAAQKTAENLSNAIQAGSRRPVENGTSAQAASVTKFDYRTASPEQREALRGASVRQQREGRNCTPEDNEITQSVIRCTIFSL